MDDSERDARLARRARTGRQEHAVRIERDSLGGSDLVVAKNTLLHAQLAEILDEVEGERIEVVDDEQHADYSILARALTAGSSMPVGFHRRMAEHFQLLK